MNILTEIIEQLIDNSVPLTDSLLKIKVLASRLSNKTLYNWIDTELSGYESNPPKYRTSGCVLYGNMINGRFHLKNQIIATQGLPDFVKNHVEKMNFNQPVSVLERYIKENKNPLVYAIPAELYGYLTEYYQEMGNHYMSVYSANKRVDLGVVQQILSEIRNQTLDLLLKLEEEFGVEIDMKELIRKKGKANEIINNNMKQTIINKGDGNIINTGEKNKITSNITITKSNFEELSNALRENHVPEKEIEELKKVIDEKPNFEKKLFSEKVNSWIQKMTSKALNGSWQIGIGASGTLLGELLKKYYGM